MKLSSLSFSLLLAGTSAFHATAFSTSFSVRSPSTTPLARCLVFPVRPLIGSPSTSCGTGKYSNTQLDQLKSSSVSTVGWDSTGTFQKLQQAFGRCARSIRNNEVTQWRLVFVSMLASLFIFRKAMDAKLVLLWDYLLHSNGLYARIFRTDSWEWCWAIGCFIVWIHGFGYADRLVRRADQEGRIHPWKKYRLQDRYEADKQRRMLQKRDLVESKESNDVVNADDKDDDQKPLQVQHSAWNWKLWLQELPVYAVPLLIWDITAPRRHRRIGGFGAPTTMGILGGVVGGLFLYDFLFFLGHVTMHKIPFIHRTVHAKHHKTAEVRACEIVRLGVAEEVLEVLFSIIALNFLSVHPVARTIYNAVITFLLTELHCGFDFPWTPQNVVPFGLATGSRRHHYHHRNGKHYYQKFFYHVDRIFGFYQKNDGSLQGDSVQAKPYIPPAWQSA